MWLENYFVLSTDVIPSVIIITTAGPADRLHDNRVWDHPGTELKGTDTPKEIIRKLMQHQKLFT